MTFEVIALTGMLIGWIVCAYLPWFLFSVLTRGSAGMLMLPLCLFAGLVGALAVPILGLQDGTGLALSFVAAALVPAALMAARRFAMPARAHTHEHVAAPSDAIAAGPEGDARG